MKIESINPYNNQSLASYPALSAEEAIAKAIQSERAFVSWKRTSFEERADILLKVAEILKDRCDELAELASLEMGKTLKEAKAEVLKCGTACTYYAENGARFLQAEKISTEKEDSFVAYEPLGPVLGIMPWNFPYWQVFRFAVPTLMAGNTALLKHASNVPQCAMAIERIFLEAGLPDNVFQTLLLPSSLVDVLLSHTSIKAASLTGSTDAGSKVAAVAGKHIKKTVLELGGSDPFIVLADANIEKAAKMAVQARMQNNGQSCIAAKRFIVEAAVMDSFMQLVKAEIMSVKAGDPLQDGIQVGPLAKIEFADVLAAQLQKGLDAGATLVYGGKRSGAMFEPTLVLINNAGNLLFQEETFGPLMTVMQVQDTEEAITVANNTSFGLGSSLWTGDLDKARRLAPRIEAGSVFVNAMMASDSRLPFGGTKQSGMGRELSQHGIREFVNVKTVAIDRS